MSVPLAGAFAALGAGYPDADGVSMYVRTAFGRHAAAVVGRLLYFAIPVGAPPAAMFAGAYVAAAFGGGMRTTLLTGAALIVALLLAGMVTALPHAYLANLRPFAPHGRLVIGPAAGLLVWVFAGRR
ncbi:MAG: hypothetical protein AUI14_11115 [Actinobacteria bacterium 13_2_20CM_2_71_6]|nr:MAG: hypothetical protein AUI14_11115 [Actinobacteria bacterium 13_2_20CM_2_71_6]